MSETMNCAEMARLKDLWPKIGHGYLSALPVVVVDLGALALQSDDNGSTPADRRQ
jgi:hypothetical protein